MEIAPELIDRIVAHARRDFPNECCGMIAVRDGRAVSVHEAENLAASPLRFEVDGLEVHRTIEEIEDAGGELGAIYHSHTRSEPYPSQTDINFAAGWPGVEWLIVGLRRNSREAVVRSLPHRRRPRVRGRGRAWLTAARRSSARAAARRTRPTSASARECGMPLTYAGRRDLEVPVSAAHARARKIKPQYSEGDLVRVVGARNQAEAELIQGLLLEEGVPSMLRRSRGFDVPDMLAAGPRDVMVPASGAGAGPRRAAARPS